MIKRKEKINQFTNHRTSIVTLNEFLNSCSLTLNSNQAQTQAQVVDIRGPESCEYLRAYSHEPGTVNYSGGNDCPGASVISHSQNHLLSRGNVAGKFSVI